MKFIPLTELPSAYIWSARALTGPFLRRRDHLLVRLQSGRVVSMEEVPRERLPREVENHPHFFDLGEDSTLMPALLDAHVHLALNGKGFRESVAQWDHPGDLWRRIRQDLYHYRQRGIGLVRDGGDVRGINLEVAQYQEQGGNLDLPGVLAPGQALRREDSYGSFLGGGFANTVEMQDSLRRLISRKVDHLKVLLSGIVSFKKYGKVAPTSVSLEELEYLVQEAHAQGLKVMAHASSEEAINLAIKAGVDTLEHGYFISEASLKEMAQRSIVWIPTLLPVAVQTREPFNRYWSGEELEVINRTVIDQQKRLSRARELGVPVGLGTDAGAGGVRHGLSLLEEMQLYAQAGWTPKDILQSAVSVNAQAMGIPSSDTVLDVNSSPHLIGIRGDPLDDLCSLGIVDWFFKGAGSLLN